MSVLTTGFWPIPGVPDCTLPAEASAQCQHFTLYYTNLHSGRRLTWQTSLGTAELRCQFLKGFKYLVVHTYQMCILMLYNKQPQFTYEEILKQTQIPDEELQRHLISLAHPKVKVLLKKPNVKEIAKDHVFAYNKEYTNPLIRVKVSTDSSPLLPSSRHITLIADSLSLSLSLSSLPRYNRFNCLRPNQLPLRQRKTSCHLVLSKHVTIGMSDIDSSLVGVLMLLV